MQLGSAPASSAPTTMGKNGQENEMIFTGRMSVPPVCVTVSKSRGQRASLIYRKITLKCFSTHLFVQAALTRRL